MRQFRGIRLFFYNFSAAGSGLFLTFLVIGSISFYYPPLELVKEGLLTVIPPFLAAQVPVLCLIALLGILGALGFLPFIASHSDRSRSPLGKRRVFLLAAIFPIFASAILFFLPLVPAPSAVNAVFLTLLALIFCVSKAAYRIPYLTLINELAGSDEERLSVTLSQTLAILIGALIAVGGIPLFFEALAPAGIQAAYQFTFLILTVVGALVLSAAFIVVKGKEPPSSPGGPMSAGRSFRAALSNPTFRAFLSADSFSFFAFAVLLVSILAVGSDLMLVDEAFIQSATAVLIGSAIVCVPVIWLLTRSFGKKLVTTIGLLTLASSVFLLAFTGLLPNTSGLRWNCTTSIAETKDGEIFIGTWRGASIYKNGEWKGITKNEGLIDDRITSIVAAEDGVWFGTYGGASFFDGKKWTHFSKASGLIDNQVDKIIKRGKAVWFETPKGISLLDNASWQQYIPEAEKKDQPVSPVTALVLGDRGDLWLGTQAGAFHLSETGWTGYSKDNGLKDDTITSLAVAPNGDILFGTYKGVARLAGKTWSYITTSDGLPSNAVRRIKVAPDGRIFIATAKGVFVTDGVNKQVLTTADGLAHNKVNDICFTANGAVWYATGNGVSEFANGIWKNYQYPLPWIWGLILFIFLGFPAALLLSLPSLFCAEIALVPGKKNEGNRGAMFFSIQLMARLAALAGAGVLVTFLFSSLGQTIANPLPVRIVLITASLAAVLASLFYGRYPFAGTEK